jgi:hypothetical protein
LNIRTKNLQSTSLTIAFEKKSFFQFNRRITMRTLIQVVGLSLVLLIGTAHAQQASSQKSETGAGTPVLETTQNTTTDKMYDKVTSVMQNMVGSVDTFFADEDYSAFRDNTSRMRLRLDTTYVEHHGWEINPKLKFHLVFPGLGNRIRLVMNEDEDDASSGASGSDDNENDVALRWRFTKIKKASVSFDLGLRTKDSSLDPFVRLNTAIRYDMGKKWYGQTYNRLYYYSKTDWRNDFRQSFNRKITEDLLFRARTRIQYFDENGYNPYLEEKFSLFQTLNKKSAIAYEAIWQKQDVEDSVYDEDEILGKPKDNYQAVALRLRYRRNVWRDWLYVEFWPIVAWPEERDWDTVLAGLFRLEVTFGGKGKSKLGKYRTTEYRYKKSTRTAHKGPGSRSNFIKVGFHLVHGLNKPPDTLSPKKPPRRQVFVHSNSQYHRIPENLIVAPCYWSN